MFNEESPADKASSEKSVAWAFEFFHRSKKIWSIVSGLFVVVTVAQIAGLLGETKAAPLPAPKPIPPAVVAPAPEKPAVAPEPVAKPEVKPEAAEPAKPEPAPPTQKAKKKKAAKKRSSKKK